MFDDKYKIVVNKIKIVIILIIMPSFAMDNPIANVALVKDRRRGAHAGHIEVKNAGITAKYPYIFL